VWGVGFIIETVTEAVSSGPGEERLCYSLSAESVSKGKNSLEEDDIFR
jgi:hypothetical protein